MRQRGRPGLSRGWGVPAGILQVGATTAAGQRLCGQLACAAGAARSPPTAARLRCAIPSSRALSNAHPQVECKLTEAYHYDVDIRGLRREEGREQAPARDPQAAQRPLPVEICRRGGRGGRLSVPTGPAMMAAGLAVGCSVAGRCRRSRAWVTASGRAARPACPYAACGTLQGGDEAAGGGEGLACR